LSFYLWRHFPDVLAAITGILIAAVGTIRTVGDSHLTAFVFLYWVLLACIVVSMLQVGPSRFNFTRYLLETPVLNILGYCSFPLYLYQMPIMEYANGIYRNKMYQETGIDKYSYKYWYHDVSWEWRLLYWLIVIVFCYVIQYSINEIIVPNVLIRVFSTRFKSGFLIWSIRS